MVSVWKCEWVKKTYDADDADAAPPRCLQHF